MTHRVFDIPLASVYPYYVAKAVRRGRTKEEVDEVIKWLTGYDQNGLEQAIIREVTFREFFAQAPSMNPKRKQITGKVCGVQVEDITDPLMREIRYLDKLVDELNKTRPLSKILRTE